MYFETLKQLQSYVEQLKIEEKDQLMIMVGEESSVFINELIGYLNSKGINFFGGIFPSLLIETQHTREGFIVHKYSSLFTSLVAPNLLPIDIELEKINHCTAILLADGLSSKMKELTDTIYNKIGNRVTYVGGGAGFFDLIHRPCIFNSEGIFEDVAIICIVPHKTVLSVKHGWEKLAGPFSVTKSNENTLSELDCRNAFDVYQEIIENEEDLILYGTDFFEVAKDHPFGIVKNTGQELVVRDPIALNEKDEIICVADVPESSLIYVLKGNKDTLLNASLEVVKECSINAPVKYNPLLFDCISRAMFLEGLFNQELVNIQSKLRFPLEGALSIGEIASLKNGIIEIHNKSSVLGLLDIA
ncbi:MAG: FIST domain-containing protein [Candidatus Methanofastidiosa archaeon]|nr:FIST domain-containing protein [Candidatus Epulonipiscium sp.]NMA32064.1 FIST domain-containing protein [Candidatus Methanofastidiosa archaeon]